MPSMQCSTAQRRACTPGQWRARAPLPIPRTEMAWAVAYRGRMHGGRGGYAEQRVDRPYHHAYDPAADAWQELPQLPRGASHVGVATLGDRLYAFGGFIEQNRTPHDEGFAFDGEKWTRIRRLPETCGAMACIALGGARPHADTTPRHGRGRARRCGLCGWRWPANGRGREERHQPGLHAGLSSPINASASPWADVVVRLGCALGHVPRARPCGVAGQRQQR